MDNLSKLIVDIRDLNRSYKKKPKTKRHNASDSDSDIIKSEASFDNIEDEVEDEFNLKQIVTKSSNKIKECLLNTNHMTSATISEKIR